MQRLEVMEKANSRVTALVVFVHLLLSNQSLAASFDCAKASNDVEKLICADSELSALDSTLGNLFSSGIRKNTDVATDQKKWLREQRNTCKTPECIKAAYSRRIEYLKTLEECPYKASVLVGSWVRVEGNGFEKMKFLVSDKTPTFLSWLHHKPEMAGRWGFEQCVIHIQDSNEDKLQFDLKVQRLDEKRLDVRDMDDGAVGIYERAAAAK